MIPRVGILALVFTATAAVSNEQQATKPQPEPKAKQATQRLSTELDAVGWAFEALTKYPEARRPFIRFVWLPPWADPEWIGVMDFAVNAACSQVRSLYRADRHAGGWLLAYDLSLYAHGKELEKLIDLWDSLAVRDPYFHVPEVNVQEIEVECERCGGSGQIILVDPETKEESDPQDCDVCGGSGKVKKKGDNKVALLAPHLSAALARHVKDRSKDKRIDVLVTQLTASTGAIYRADWLLEQLLTSIRGKYPEFRQIDFDPKVQGKTPLQVRLEKYGFSIESSEKLGGDKCALLLISGVTGKHRIIASVFGLASRQPLVLSYDPLDNRVRPDEHFIRNLIEFKPFADAGELFVPMPNGLIEYLLATSDGKLQRKAPPDLVADSSKPDGFTKELEPAMSCIMCHFASDHYILARNDMEYLFGSDTDFFGDDLSVLRDGKKVVITREEVIDILAGRYGERLDEPDGILGRARRDFSRAIVRLTDYKTQADGPSVVARLGQKIREIYHTYRYKPIDAQRACLELGIKVSQEESVAALRQLCPPKKGQIEDVLIAVLRNGAKIRRDDFEAVYGELARRAVQSNARKEKAK